MIKFMCTINGALYVQDENNFALKLNENRIKHVFV